MNGMPPRRDVNANDSATTSRPWASPLIKGRTFSAAAVALTLAAQSGGVTRMIVGQGFSVAAIGLAFGLPGAFALTRVMQTLLFNVSPTDPASFVIAPGVLALVAFAACYIPAQRATTVDPATVLKPE